MAFTQSDLDEIDGKIARAETAVTYADRSSTFDDVEGLLKRRAVIVAGLQSGRPKQTQISTGSGFDR